MANEITMVQKLGRKRLSWLPAVAMSGLKKVLECHTYASLLGTRPPEQRRACTYRGDGSDNHRTLQQFYIFGLPCDEYQVRAVQFAQQKREQTIPAIYKLDTLVCSERNERQSHCVIAHTYKLFPLFFFQCHFPYKAKRAFNDASTSKFL